MAETCKKQTALESAREADRKQFDAALSADKIQGKINEKIYAEKVQKEINKSMNYTDGFKHKMKEKLRDRRVCNMCSGVLVVGIIVASSMMASLISARLAGGEHYCNMGCILNSASWTNFTAKQVEKLTRRAPGEILDALSKVYVEQHAVLYSQSHREKHAVHKLKDAHEKLAGQLHAVSVKWQDAMHMKDGPEKAEKLKEIIDRSSTLEQMADQVNHGKSFDEVKLGKMTEAETSNVRSCADTLRKVGVGPCSDDPGTTTGLLRAMGAASVPKQLEPLAQTWPLSRHFPGVQTLNAEHGIHVVDGFLSPSECAALVASGTLVQQQNRSAVTHNSLVSLKTLTATEEQGRKRRNAKWIYSGMPGALIQLDIKSKGLKDCKPFGHDDAPGAWEDSIGPLFQESGQDLKKCSKSGFGDTRYYDLACPSNAGVMKKLEAKASTLLQAPASQLAAPHLVHYGQGDFDLDHYDTDAGVTNGQVAPLWTLMVYLTTAKGGGTYFPSLDLRVDPMVGRALIFPTLTMNLTVATGSLHAEEEVKKGDKWVLGTSLILGSREQSPSACK